MATKGLVLARAGVVDGARQQFLAGAALAGDQYARIGAGHHVRLRELLFDQRGARDDLRAPVLVRIHEAGDAQRLLHLVQQLLLVDRLGQEAERAQLRGMHGVRNRAVRREDDDLEARVAGLQFLQQADAVHLVHAQVGDHQLGPEAAGGRQRQCRTFDGFDLVVLRAQADGQEAQQPRVVVDDQDAGLAFGGMGSGELHGGLHQKPLRLPSLRLRRAPVVRRALDVRDGVQLGLSFGEQLLETGIFFALGGQSPGQLRDSIVRAAFGSCLQSSHVRLESSAGVRPAAAAGTREHVPQAAESQGWRVLRAKVAAQRQGRSPHGRASTAPWHNAARGWAWAAAL